MHVLFFLCLLFFSKSALACPTCLGEKDNQPFVANSAIPFKNLMESSMHGMDSKMTEVNLEDKDNTRVFLKMMIAHHQGALDMANSIIVHTTNPEIINYARSIVATQYNEILYMQTLLKKMK